MTQVLSTLDAAAVDLVHAIVARLKTEPGPLLPILHGVQDALGYVPGEALTIVAAELNLSRAEVYGVATFYHDFRHAPAGRHLPKLCRAEACQSMGCEDLVARAESTLGIACGQTTADRAVTLEPAYCLGLCATAPSAMIDGRPVGRLNEARLDALLRQTQADLKVGLYESQESPKAGLYESQGSPKGRHETHDDLKGGRSGERASE